MKSSNPKVMINAYRMLAARLLELGPDWNYPLHLGVTEAGDGEDGRIKSAIGIGALAGRRPRRYHPRLAHGRQRARDPRRAGAGRSWPASTPRTNCRRSNRRSASILLFSIAAPASTSRSAKVPVGGAALSTRVGATLNTFQAIEHKRVQLGDLFPDFVVEKGESIIEIDPRRRRGARVPRQRAGRPHLVTIADGCSLSPIVAYPLPRRADSREASHPAQGHLHAARYARRRARTFPRHHAQRR